MQEMDPWGQGVLTKEGVEKHISDFTSITAMKMKNDKPFFIRTKKDAAYPSVSTENDISVEDPNMEDDDSLNCFCRTNGWIRCIIPKDHFFDTKARTRRTRKVKPFKFTNLNDQAKGNLPIRTQYSYRINETKILPSKRLGLNSV
ncbi:Hypothetical predicted protein [Mytilus galloprovincialis]|uniref:Uncharacterized protein n=1 Tax=Mytilus galloprovincialis TaxID=29158 RepID=A0A8B6GVD1_MYTGA|nr:Hypothetical predicted protein [Mytilus galloprovincialis]